MQYSLGLKPAKPLPEMTDKELIHWIQLCCRWWETLRMPLDDIYPDFANLIIVSKRLYEACIELISRREKKELNNG